jgi:hypothetical protein
VLERRLVDPVEDDQLRAQIEEFHVRAPQVHCLGRGGVAPLEYKGQTDVLDATAVLIDLVGVPVLHDRAGERKFTYTRYVGHGLWATIGVEGGIHPGLSLWFPSAVLEDTNGGHEPPFYLE